MGIFELGGVSLLVAFVAGLLSCASPCVLPLIPAYLGYLTGASFEGAAGPGQQPVGAAGGAGRLGERRRGDPRCGDAVAVPARAELRRRLLTRVRGVRRVAGHPG